MHFTFESAQPQEKRATPKAVKGPIHRLDLSTAAWEALIMFSTQQDSTIVYSNQGDGHTGIGGRHSLGDGHAVSDGCIRR